MTLAAVASVTKKITLGTNILLAPLYNPVKLAEDIAVLDNLASGRLTIGLAPGYVPEEFAGLMIPYSERVGRFEETVDILISAWTQETFSYDGKYFTVPETRLTPKPFQDPHPQLWYGVSGPKMLERAAERGAVFVGSPRHTTEELLDHLRKYRGFAEASGYAVPATPIMRGVFIAGTTEEAEAIAGPAITHQFRETYGKNSQTGSRPLVDDQGRIVSDMAMVSFENFKERYLIGSPEHVIPRLAALQEKTGMTELSCWMQLPGLSADRVMSSARLFAEKIMPRFK
jgi:alkanesulfonate monooxygenase SsuD/methylene tetrahydromethanopterin reductase-like flavin-dependent oxidoreductase (luciferase family)